LNDAATAGFDGLIVPDLPLEESASLMNRTRRPGGD
jgi:tryptophan synthase alpha subunit